MATKEDRGQRRRVALRQVFVAKINRDQELDTVMSLAASALRIGKGEVETTLKNLLAQFDQLLVHLVKSQDTLYAADVFALTDHQKNRVKTIWAAEYAAARDFLVGNFGEEVRRYADKLADRRVLQLRNGTA